MEFRFDPDITTAMAKRRLEKEKWIQDVIKKGGGDFSSLSDFNHVKGLLKHITYVYVIGIRGHRTYYKVGVSTNPRARLEQLQSGNPLEIHVIKEYGWFFRQEALNIESLVHRKLREVRSKGEWFKAKRQHIFAVIDKSISVIEPSSVDLRDKLGFDLERKYIQAIYREKLPDKNLVV